MTTDQTNAPRQCRECGKALRPNTAGGRARVRCERCIATNRKGTGPCVVCGRACPTPGSGGRVRACSEKCRQKWILQRYARAVAKAAMRG